MVQRGARALLGRSARPTRRAFLCVPTAARSTTPARRVSEARTRRFTISTAARSVTSCPTSRISSTAIVREVMGSGAPRGSAAGPTGNQRRSAKRKAKRPSHQFKVEPATLPTVATSHSVTASSPWTSSPSIRISDAPGSTVAASTALANRLR
jgi:hypothetical protein